MIHIEDLQRVGIDLTKTDGIPVAKLFTMPRKISDLEQSDRRTANLLHERVSPKRAFQGGVLAVSAFGLVVIAWFALCQN